LLHWKLGSGIPSESEIQTAIERASSNGTFKSKPHVAVGALSNVVDDLEDALAGSAE
jgi:hypothetical protein